MSTVWSFLSRTQGKHGRLTPTDYAAYAYLILGFLIIFIPVSWIGLNSIKSAFQLEKQDLSLLPTDYVRVGRATVNGPDGREIFIISSLPDWVLNWRDLGPEERAAQDIDTFLTGLTGRELYVLRSHLGLVPAYARELIEEKSLPDWLIRYSSMAQAGRDALDLDGVLARLDSDEQRLLMEFTTILGCQCHHASGGGKCSCGG